MTTCAVEETIFLSFSSLFSFFFYRPLTLLFWFTLSALIRIAFSSSSRHLKSSDKPSVQCPGAEQRTDTVSDSLVNTVERLAKETGISLRSWWRPKAELKESEYWAYIHQVTRNTTPNESLCWLISAGCINKQLFAIKFILKYYNMSDVGFTASLSCQKVLLQVNPPTNIYNF